MTLVMTQHICLSVSASLCSLMKMSGRHRIGFSVCGCVCVGCCRSQWVCFRASFLRDSRFAPLPSLTHSLFPHVSSLTSLKHLLALALYHY